ncbi:MAG: UDP-3-O-(3-hydroxymyristoyl)glucosamine N-acyltransferase [Gammaproteobacteria bacterium]|nr:UDP-3-O-(3-hydroxymyristoyl)glucosamine N-acyltransferase [Gammaproteobacteria bacterium]MCP5138927.1 UDP-3-O-(3-hydroxymyristoyl)glucosamine N-acyltransferase [Chromatiales bacterium]
MGMTLGQLAVRYGCELRGDPDSVVHGVATLASAAPGSISFLANPVYRSQLASTRATAVILRTADAAGCPVAVLVAQDPYAVYARVAAELHPVPPLRPGIHAAAVLGAATLVPSSCQIDAGAVLADRVSLGERVSIGANVVIGEGVEVGAGTRICAGAVIYTGVRLGSRCIIHSGAVIGADGFGFARERDGSQLKVPQIGGVVIGDDVEIGACTTIDRGAIGDTFVADGVKLDNQIQVGHNVRIGAHTVIAGQAGISGSTIIGARCTIGGRAAIAGHIVIADDVVIGGGTSVTGSLLKPGIYAGGGTPADTLQRWRRNMVRFGQLDELARRLRAVEKRINRDS